MKEHLERLLVDDERQPRERKQLVRLIQLLAELPPPPDPIGLYPRYEELREELLSSMSGDDGEALEERFLTLYAHVHGFEAPYTPDERRHVDERGGYWCHAGGISPILKAGPFIHEDTVSGDFGAGNGLQGLLLQVLHPHRRTIQVEISSRMVECGRHLQRWLGIDASRVEWVVSDVADVSPAAMDFVYIYRPVRPSGPGIAFYQAFAAQLEQADRPRVIFSIADCLKDFLSPRFEVFYNDGHLTCFESK